MGGKSLTVADFFCGAGGFSEGFREKGFDVVFALDNWKPAVDTHDLNHPECKCVLMDILELDTPQKINEVVPDVDIIIGSPPCVAFSGSNKAGKADKSLGIRLIEAYLRIIALKKKKGVLKYWILENVPNSSKYIKNEYTWEELGLPGKGIALKVPVRNLFNAAYFGAPQTRKRFVCGDYPVPEATHDETNWITIKDVMDSLSNPLDGPTKKTVTDPVHRFGIPVNKLTDHFYDSTVQEFEWSRAKRLKQDHGFMGKMSFPEAIDRPSRTVMATMSSSTRESMVLQARKNNKDAGYRSPTIREIATFMGFPINYQFAGNNESTKYKLVGNAVCVPLSAALAGAILAEERKKEPSYPLLPEAKPPVDLTGTKRMSKESSKRRMDAKFAIHIPELKIKGFRVELTNKSSNFSNGKFIWTCFLHYGSGKGAKHFPISKEILSSFIKDKNNVKFIKIVEEIFSLNMTHGDLQRNYVMNGHAKGLTPEKILQMMKKRVDISYPVSSYADKYIACSFENGDKKDVPIRIMAGAYVCYFFVKNLK